MSIVYGSGRTRITLYTSAGVAAYRVTLQVEQREGLQVTFQAEGVEHQLGSGASWARRWTHRGIRPLLAISWDYGLSSTLETWVPAVTGPPAVAAHWGTAATESTAQALGRIQSLGLVYPCLVEPHLDSSFSFTAQPDPGAPLVLQDVRRALHSGLALDLIGTSLLATVPVWS